MDLRELYNKADYKDELGMCFNGDCITSMKDINDKSIDMILTDIPYDMVNRNSNGLRKLNKEKADVLTFNLQNFLEQIYRISKSGIIIFCGVNQVSDIYKFFAEKQNKKQGTVRQLIWQKTNPSPMNGEHIYLSGIENAIWFKKKGGIFNAHCKNTVFKYSNGRSKIHPTEKNHDLLKELILDNTNENDIILDPCSGSFSTCLISKELKRRYIGIELDKDYFDIGVKRLKGEL